MNKRKIGAKYEKIAKDYLESINYKILDTNYFTKIGEIDIIAKDNDYYVFIEVKFRNSLRYGYGYEAVNKIKQNRIINSSKLYLYSHKISFNEKIRYDVLSIDGDNITVIKNAFP